METSINSESTKDISDMYILNYPFYSFSAVFTAFFVRYFIAYQLPNYLRACCW
jgi:hypothetical protein